MYFAGDQLTLTHPSLRLVKHSCLEALICNKLVAFDLLPVWYQFGALLVVVEAQFRVVVFGIYRAQVEQDRSFQWLVLVILLH
jgi:hypothetical protein